MIENFDSYLNNLIFLLLNLLGEISDEDKDENGETENEDSWWNL